MWQAMILIMLIHSTTAVRRLQYPNETKNEYRGKMIVEEPCFILQEICQEQSRLTPQRLTHEEQTISIALLWNDTLEHAAAALLRATLLAAGYNQDLIELYKRDSVPPLIDSHAIAVEVPVKTGPQLQVRLTARAALINECKRIAIWIDDKERKIDNKTLRDCDFLISKTKSVPATIYIENKWNDTCAAKLLRRLKAVASKQFRIVYLNDSNLGNLIRYFTRSFFFLNTYQLSKSKEIWPVLLPKTSILNPADKTECALTEINTTALLKYAAGNNVGQQVPEAFVEFYPSFSEINGVLIEHNLKKQKSSDDNNMEQAACRWVFHYTYYNNLFMNWRSSAVLDMTKQRMIVVICKSEAQNLKEYLYMMKILENYKSVGVSTVFDRKKNPIIQTLFINCTNTDLFVSQLTSWFKVGVVSTDTYYRYFVEGVVLTNEAAIAAAPFATKFGLPLLTYDVYSGSSQPTVRSATGNVEHLVLALRRLLANCGWKRIAIISEPTLLATAVSAALRSQTAELTVREQNVTLTSDIPFAIQELLHANARIFLVNTGANTAAAVLAAAQKLKITADNNFAWIVREYNAADNATSATRPYSVSFWWRGDDGTKQTNMSAGHEYSNKLINDRDEEIVDEVSLRMKLEEKWRGRAWPLHAAPLMDALLTLLRLHYKWLRNSLWTNEKVKPIQGINQKLIYDENGVTSPLIYVQQWGTEPRPRLLATWRGGEWRGPAEMCPATDPLPKDGSTNCVFTSGDSFQPNCSDFVWFPLIVLIALVGIFFIIAAIYYSRKTFLAHALRTKTEYAKQILARRERVFEALSEHLIDRAALEITKELGSGRFGRVYQGVLRDSGNKSRTVIVAAKALREDASSAEESEFLREASMLATLDHKYIIRFVGFCVVNGPLMLLMEHAFFGDLLQYLQARRCLVEENTDTKSTNWIDTDEKAHVSAKAITKLAQEAAMALAYLTERGIVHRDVRAANCLVDERRCLKLADFGLARATDTVDGEYQMCHSGVLPVSWMAPESIAKGVFSPASDVWSFGVLVFELVTLGRRPYGVLPPSVVMQHVVAGGRPQIPLDASAETRSLTQACWQREPEARATATHLADWLSTRWRALHPTTNAEFVYIDNLGNENDSNELYRCPPDVLHNASSVSALLPNQSEYIAMDEI